MKLIPVDIKDIPRLTYYPYTRTNYKCEKEVSEFMSSEYSAVEVITEPGEYYDYSACTTSLRRAIHALKAQNIRCISRKGTVYLIKEDMV